MKPYYKKDGIVLYHGDARQVVDDWIDQGPSYLFRLVLTDPPYIKKDNWVWEWLARRCHNWLRKGGSFHSLCGVINLPQIFQTFGELSVLEYYWTCVARHQRGHIPNGRDIQVFWKPAVWYVKGGKPLPKPDFPKDMIHIPKEKGSHPWQQGYSWFHYWVSFLTKPGDRVFDPFAGFGTTLMACKTLGRKCVGVELEEKHCENIVRRLEETPSIGLICESTRRPRE